MQRSKVRVVVGSVCGAGALALCLVAGFRVVSAAEVALATREVSLGRVHPGAFPKSLAVSPNSKRVAYAARRGGKGFVVVDGVEGKEYDGFMKGSRLIFDSPSQFHTLALSGNEFSRVEVEIVMPAAEPSGAPRPHL